MRVIKKVHMGAESLRRRAKSAIADVNEGPTRRLANSIAAIGVILLLLGDFGAGSAPNRLEAGIFLLIYLVLQLAHGFIDPFLYWLANRF